MAKLQTELLFDIKRLSKIITQNANDGNQIIIEDFLAGLQISPVTQKVIIPLEISRTIYVRLEGESDADAIFYCNVNGVGIENPTLVPVPFDANGIAIVEFSNNSPEGINIVFEINGDSEVELALDTWYAFEFNGASL